MILYTLMHTAHFSPQEAEGFSSALTRIVAMLLDWLRPRT